MITEEAIRLATPVVQRWEGFRAKPYLCPAGIATIGYGSTHDPEGRPVSLEGGAIDESTACVWLEVELNRNITSALRLCPVLINEPAHRLAAVASFIYNLGAGRLQASTLRRKINDRDWAGAANEFKKWVMAGGRKLPGLVARRADSAALFQGVL